jgi:hypothetical protein
VPYDIQVHVIVLGANQTGKPFDRANALCQTATRTSHSRERFLLQAHIAIINRSSIDVLTQPRDEGIFDVGIAADDDPVMERGIHGGILPVEIGVDMTRKGVSTKNSP